VASAALKIAPKIAAPTLWPRNRQNMTVPVTTPRCSQVTVDCGPTSVQTEMRPSPNPSTNVLTTGCHTCT
jgi:hypothetical protein